MIKYAKLLKRSHIPWVREKGVSGVNGYLVEQIFTPETPFYIKSSGLGGGDCMIKCPKLFEKITYSLGKGKGCFWSKCKFMIFPACAFVY